MTLAPNVGGITLTVQQQDGEPVKQARVLLTSGPRHADLAALTNAMGRASFGGLLPGEYEFAVLAVGRRKQFSVKVIAGEELNADIVID